MAVLLRIINHHVIMKKRGVSMLIGVIVLLFGIFGVAKVLFPAIDIDFDILWPSVIILIALYNAIKKKTLDFWIVFLFFVGVWALLWNLDYIPEEYSNIFWPLILIMMGITIIYNTSKFKKRVIRKINIVDGDCNYNAIFSGIDEKITSDDFKGCNISAIFGGVELDFSDAIIKDDINITITSIFGGTDITLPAGFKLVIEPVSIFGGTDNKYKTSTKKDAKTIYVSCISIFGGTDIKG